MMKGTVSKQTRNNWLIDAAVFIGAFVAAITGIYFLFLPSGGYQGGRNPMYGITILFSRQTWDDLHTWFGALMIAAVVIHFAIHWSWVKGTARRMTRSLVGRGARMNRHGYFNIAIDATVALSFLLAAVSGVYFMFVPGGRWAADPGFIFARTTWDLMHTWSGVALIAAAVIHFVIHWNWVTKVTAKVFRSLVPSRLPASQGSSCRWRGQPGSEAQ
jgi:cytochrome b subunit of formate dehydrogenase